MNDYPPQYPLLKITWTGTSSKEAGWYELHDITPAVAHVSSIGYLIKETEQYKTLAGSIAEFDDEPDQFTAIIHIPIAGIKSVKKLRTAGDRE